MANPLLNDKALGLGNLDQPRNAQSANTWAPPSAEPMTDGPVSRWDGGIMTVKGTAKPGTAFLGHAMGKMNGPAVLKLRVRSQTGGAGKIETFPKGSAVTDGMVSTPFEVKAGDWQDLSIDLKTSGPLGTLRLYLPDGDIDSIEIAPAKGKAERWNF